MVQILMLLGGIATGLKCRAWRQALTIIVAMFLVGMAIQTPIVAADDGIESAADAVVYTIINIVSLAVGLGIAYWLQKRRLRRPLTSA